MSATEPSREGAASAFSGPVVLAFVLTAVLAFCAYVALSAFAPDLRDGADGGAHALSSSATGYAAITRLMRLQRQSVFICRTAGLRHTFRGLLVVTPGRPLGAGDVSARIGDRLIVLPKWVAMPDENHPGWVVAAGEVPPAALATFAPAQLGRLTVSRRKGRGDGLNLTSSLDGWGAGQPLGPVQDLQTVSGPKLIPLVTDPSGAAVLAAVSGSRTFVLADPDMINTEGIADIRTARIALLMLENLHDPGAPVCFDVSLNGLGTSQSLLKLALEPPFVGATLSLVVAAALVGLQAWGRFGAPAHPSRELALGKTALVETAAGMIGLAKREPKMAARYVRLCRERVLKALGAANLAEAAQDAFLDRWAKRVAAQDRIADLQARAGEVRTSGELVALAQRTRQWRGEMTRGTE